MDWKPEKKTGNERAKTKMPSAKVGTSKKCGYMKNAECGRHKNMCD